MCVSSGRFPAGSFGDAGDVSRTTVMPPISQMDRSRRAMEKGWIREEMHLRMVVERKILEEEVKMELELESLMATRRIQAGNAMVAVALEREHGEDRFPESGSDKVQPSNKEISETRRETTIAYASNEALKLVQGLSCALCQVSATSEKLLNEHLAGRKHRAKLAALQKKSGAKMSVGSLSSNREIALDVKEAAIANSIPNIMIFQINGKKHQVLRKGMSLLCECCNMTCSNSSMMLSHLVGKKCNASAKSDEDTSQVKTEKDYSPVEATVGKCDMEIIDDIAAPDVVAKDKIAANWGESIERGEEPFENDSGKDPRPAEATIGTCSMDVIEKGIHTAPAYAVKDDIAANEEESIVKKGKEPFKNSAEMATGEVQPSNKEIPETKRVDMSADTSKKAPNLAQGFSCSLCHVSANSEKTLNKHLAGKKHRAKLASLQEKTGGNMSIWSLSSNRKIELDVREEGISNSTPDIMNFQINGKKHQVMRKGLSLLCERCNMTCSNSSMMFSHLVGKKHNASQESDKETRQVRSEKDYSSAEVDRQIIEDSAALDVEKGISNSTPDIMFFQINGKKHQVLRKGLFLLCESCNMTCNNSSIMFSHLVGKKHNASSVLDKDTSQVRSDKDYSPAEADMEIIEGIASATVVAKVNIAANGGENIQKGEEPFKNNSGNDLRPANVTTGTCCMGVIKDILTAPAHAVKDDIATNGEESIVKKGKEPFKDSTQMPTGEVQPSNNGIIGTKRKVATDSKSEKALRLV